MKKPIVLRIYKGDQLQGVKQFLDPQIVIGSQPDVQVALEGPAVAILHAQIEERGEGLYHITDLGSESGTYRNGGQVLDEAIQSGDTIQIGDYKIEFYIGAPKPKTGNTGAFTVPPELRLETQPSIAIPQEQPKQPEPKPVQPAPAPPPQAKPPEPAKPVVQQSAPVPPKPVPPPPQPKAQEPKPVIVQQPKAPAPQPAPVVSAAAAGAFTEPVTSPTGIPLAGPKGSAAPHSKAGKGKKGKKGAKTFAPASRYGNVKEFVKPSKGTVVEVLVAWRERVIGSYHFSKTGVITLGAHPDNDVVVPLLNSKIRKVPILKIDRQATVLVGPEMSGEVIRGQTGSSFSELIRNNRMAKVGQRWGLALDQGEMAKVDLSDQVSVIIRYVSDSPKPIVAPLLDLTTSELTGIVLSFVMVATLWLYTYLYTPPKALPEEEAKEPDRVAILIRPTPVPTPPPPMPTPEVAKVQPTPPPVRTTPVPRQVRATPIPKPVPVAENPVKKPRPAPPAPEKKVPKKVSESTAVANAPGDPGKSANLAPTKIKDGPIKPGSVKKGGAIKTSDTANSQMQSKNRDMSKAGVFSVFGTGGQNNEIAQSTTGAGELAGLAGAATGRTGYNENRAGTGLGGLKDVGRGGTGKAVEGIAGGVGTEGRGSGNSGYGTGGLGSRQGVKIVTGGGDEQLPTSIDKEAIRRVIKANLATIRTCYERQLNKNKDLFGKLVLSWVIGEQGRVVSVKTKSNELGNAEVASCIMRNLQTWRFPEPPTNQVVEVEAYPFFFSN